MESKRSGKVHFRYLVVAALVITSFVPLSLGLSCAGIFYPPLSETLGVEKGVLSCYTSVLWVAALVTLPVMGRLLDEKDARACLTGAVAIIAAAFVWLSFTSSLWQFYVAAAAMGIGVGMLLFLAPSTLINRWFAKRAGVYYCITNGRSCLQRGGGSEVAGASCGARPARGCGCRLWGICRMGCCGPFPLCVRCE